VTLSPCMACGAPIDGTRCTDCSTEQRKSYTFKPKATSTERGYDTAWRNLSERARRMQPFCTDCGREDRLTADHSPEAWRRHEAGLPIRLKDIEVVCIECNIDRGSARPGGMRSRRDAPTLTGQSKFASENGSQSVGGS